MNAYVKQNLGEYTLSVQLDQAGIKYEREYRFHAERKFRLDFAFPSLKCGVEINGGIFSQGAHGRPTNIMRDLEKSNLLVMDGWRVLRFSPQQVKLGQAIDGIKKLLSTEGK